MDHISRTAVTFFGILSALSVWLVASGAVSKGDALPMASWMAGLSDAVPIGLLNIPGTHDSGADRGCPGPLFDRYVKCQDLGIRAQLDAGIRYLDIRCRRDGNQFQIYHGQCNQGKSFGDVLADCEAFLQDNPSEAILMRVKEEHKPREGAAPFGEIFEHYTQGYLEGAWFLENFIPNLREVRGHIVLIDDAGLGMGIPWKDIRKQDEYALRNYAQKWDFVHQHLETARQAQYSDLFLNHCSATAIGPGPGRLLMATLGLVKSPRGFARNVLPRLEEYLEGTHALGRHGVVVMDFPTQEAIQGLVQSNQYLDGLN